MKKVLVLCTENTCRSIMAEALINFFYPNEIQAQSAGIKKSGTLDNNAVRALKEFGIETSQLHSKALENTQIDNFDLVVTVCDNAEDDCPIFPDNIKIIHKPFEDPKGKKFFEYLKTVNVIKEDLLPTIHKELLS